MKYSIQRLGQQFKAARKKMGLSQEALGRRVGIPQSHISKIEKGEVDLQASSLIEIARGLGLELMLVPRRLVDTVEWLERGKKGEEQTPLYQLEDFDEPA